MQTESRSFTSYPPHLPPSLSYDRESDITKERIQKIIGAGANVVLTSGGIDDLCLKYFVEAGAMAVRRCKKEDLKRIARATGGKTPASDIHLMVIEKVLLVCKQVVHKRGLWLQVLRLIKTII